MKLVGLANVTPADKPDAPALPPPSSALADLAFGSFSDASLSNASASRLTLGRHLAFLPADTLELDLSDPTQRHFGDYELLELIGEGGMGVVYRARQTSLDREVAIKLLAAGPWASREFVDRFMREARHAAGMQHPNIVTVYEIGTAEELHFFSMRLVRGATLASKLRDGPMDPRRAAALMRIVCEAVDYAHSLGVLHLDLKPANILLDEQGGPHVADFGLARRLDPALSVPNNEISGTPSYMAPEQAQLGVLSAATDIWGLGAILYELVTSEPPFRDKSAQATLKLVQEGHLRSPRLLQPKLPRDLDAIIVKCLTKDPAQRFATARELAEDLARFCEHRAVHARPLRVPQRIARWARREPRLAATAILAFGALLIGLVATTQQWRRAESNAVTATERLWDSRRDAALRLQMDGKGFEALPGLLANIDEQERAGRSAAASIERREIGAVLGQGVTLLHRMILPDASPLAVALSPDGSLMAVGLSDFSVRWFDTRTLRELGRVDLEGLPTSDGEPRLPTLLTFTENRRLRVTLEWFEFVANPSGGDSFLIDIDRAEVITPPQFADLRETIYSADGQFALLRNRHQELQLWQVEPWHRISPLLAEIGRPRGTPWALGRSARFAIPFDPGMPWPEIYDPRNLKIIRTIAHPAEVIISAWAENSDGSAMAFGDASGRMFLVDLRSFTMRQLPTPLGREVTSIAFSEDDAWLAAVRWDGAAYAFNVATGEPLNAGQMQHDFTLRQVSILHRQHLLIASGPGPDGPGRTEIWRLPEPGPYGAEAKRLIASPTRSAPVGMYTAGVSAQSGLLATASIDGEVRLWRLPLSPTLPMRTSLLVSGALYFDGEHVVDIEYAKLRVASTRGAPPTRWIELPQPVDFADLVDGARTLVATAGAEIYVFDAVTMTPRYPAIKLAANPQRLVISEDGASIVLAFGRTGARGFEERLETYDLRTGQRRLADATVSGPLRQLELSADGSKVLTTGPAHGATDVFETTTLRHIGTYPHDARTPVIWAAFESGSGNVLLITRSEGDPRADDGNLVFWDPASSTERVRRPIQHASQIGVISALGNPFVAGRDQDLLDSSVLGERIAPRLSRGEATAVLSVSHDGHLIAHAFRGEVQLYDATTASAVGAPLHTDINPADLVVQLAFSKDDRQLLARTTLGHWLLWQVAADIRPLAEIRHDADLLVPTAGAQRIVRIPDTGENERLRRRDAGTWPATDTRPLQPASREVAGGRIPARSSGTSPLLLDLTYAYTLAPDSVLNFTQSVFATMRPFPLGVVRLNGIDYDARGAIDLSRVQEISMRREGIRVPQIPIAAFHVLMFAQKVSPTPHEELEATVRLRYQDGSEARLPIRTQREVPGWSDADLPVPLAWVFGDQLRLTGYQRQQMISDPRLPNPHPERLITTLDLEAVQSNFSASSAPVFFAITAEPVIAEDDSGIPPNKADVKLKPES